MRISRTRTALAAGLGVAGLAVGLFGAPTALADNHNPIAGEGSTVTRLAGQDRYETAVAITASMWTGPLDALFIASGETFPDALAAVPLSAQTGPNQNDVAPLLLTAQGSLPQATRDAIVSLQPRQILVLGGTAAVSADVFTALEAVAPGAQVSRLAGDDRYATAARISQAFPQGTPVVYITSGTSFADALAAGPAAAIGWAGGDPGDVGSGPLLLTQADTLPEVTQAELERIKPQYIVIAGGTNAVSSAVEDQLKTLAPTVRRIAGADRYDTARQLSAAFPTRSGAYVANGTTFPDALAGGPAAVKSGSPVLLTETGTLPPGVADSISGRLQPGPIEVLGGESAVSVWVERDLLVAGDSARRPSDAETTEITEAIHTAPIADLNQVPQNYYTVESILITGYEDMVWASALLEPTPAAGANFQPSQVLLAMDGDIWKVSDVGTDAVGCPQTPQVVRAALGLGGVCPPAG